MSYYRSSPKIKFILNGDLHKLKKIHMEKCSIFSPIFESRIKDTQDLLKINYDFPNKNNANLIINIAFDIVCQKYLRSMTNFVHSGNYNPYERNDLLIELFSFCDYLGIPKEEMAHFLRMYGAIDKGISRVFYDKLFFDKNTPFVESMRTIDEIFHKYSDPRENNKMLFDIPSITRYGDNLILANTNIPRDFARKIVMTSLYNKLYDSAKTIQGYSASPYNFNDYYLFSYLRMFGSYIRSRTIILKYIEGQNKPIAVEIDGRVKMIHDGTLVDVLLQAILENMFGDEIPIITIDGKVENVDVKCGYP